MFRTLDAARPVPRPAGAWLKQLGRMARWELFLARRRALTKVLLGVWVGGLALVVVFLLLASVALSAKGSPVNADVVLALLTFPGSLSVAAVYTSLIGPVVACIAAGALGGADYGFGTLRLVVMRGTARAQLVGAQVAALGALALVAAGLLLGLGLVEGAVVGPALGGVARAMPAGGWRQLVACWLAEGLTLWTYALLTHALTTLGRSVAAGIGSALGVLFLQGALSALCAGVGAVLRGPLGGVVRALPTIFPGNSTGALITSWERGPLPLIQLGAGGSPVALDGAHALGIVLGTCAVCAALSYWLLRGRDIVD